MSEYDRSGAMRLWPMVAVATSLVLGLPVALVWWLRGDGVVASAWLCIALAVALSILVSGVASAIWMRCPGAERAVFSELLLWGWLRHLRAERQLVHLLGPLGDLPSERECHADASTREPTAEFLAELASALDAQDPYTDGHSRRVARHATMVARELKLSDDTVQRIRTAAALHDIGKIRVPSAVLNKRAALTPEEFEAVKHHATGGAAIVAGLGDDELTAIVRHHHERFDGAGYPAGLRGDEIPLGARIVAVADTFDALTSLRPYRTAASHKQALDLLAEAAGTQLDPAVVRAFLRYYSGRRRSALVALLAVTPQRLFAWMHGNPSAAGNVAFGELAATVAGVATVGLAAMGTAGAVAINHAGLHPGAAQQKLAAAAAATGHPRGSVPSAPRKNHNAATGGAVVSGSSQPGRSPLGNSGRRRAASPRAATASPAQRRARGPSHAHAPAATGGPHHSNGGAGGGSPSAQPPGPGGRHRPSGGGSGSQSTPGSGHGPPGTSGAQTIASSPPSVAAPVATSAPPSGAPTTTTAPGAPGAPTGAPTTSPSPPPSGPATKDQCKKGGYAGYGFKNQGQCVAGVQSQGH